MIKINKIRCVGGSHNMPFTIGKDYHEFKTLPKSKNICVEDDNGKWHWSDGTYKSGNLSVMGGSFRLMSLPAVVVD